LLHTHHSSPSIEMPDYAPVYRFSVRNLIPSLDMCIISTHCFLRKAGNHALFVEPSKEWNQLNCCQRIHLSTIMWNMQGKDMVVCREICLPINLLRFKEVERIIRCYSLIFSAYQMPKKNKVFCVTNAYCMCQTTRTNAKSISTRAKK